MAFPKLPVSAIGHLESFVRKLESVDPVVLHMCRESFYTLLNAELVDNVLGGSFLLIFL